MSHSGGSLLIHWIVIRGLRANPLCFFLISLHWALLLLTNGRIIVAIFWIFSQSTVCETGNAAHHKCGSLKF